jgi:hypothetical protein
MVESSSPATDRTPSTDRRRPRRPTVHERLAARPPIYTLTVSERDALWAYFGDPTHDEVYLFSDGRLRDGVIYRRALTSLTAQLVAIACDGWPILFTRRSFYQWVVWGTLKRAHAGITDVDDAWSSCGLNPNSQSAKTPRLPRRSI